MKDIDIVLHMQILGCQAKVINGNGYNDTSDFNIFILSFMGGMDTILAARYRNSLFQWLAGPKASKSLSETFEA